MGKHLIIDSRGKIETMLYQRKSLSEIARCLGKDLSTISREVKKHSVTSGKSAKFRPPNKCIHRFDCQRSFICGRFAIDCKHAKHCAACTMCNKKCPDFVEDICPMLSKPPYVCNGCETEQKCTLQKRFYLQQSAQNDYQTLLTEARQGSNITQEELQKLDAFTSPLIKKGQTPHHIFVSNPNQFPCCEKTLYRYINDCKLTARNIDLPRVCRLKPRKKKSTERKIDRNCRVNRTYDDYLEFMKQNPDTAVVQMDTVESKQGGSVLLTVHLTICNFMLAFYRERNTAQSVIDIFDQLYYLLGEKNFRKLFPLLLTDNGSEFSNPLKIEFGGDSTDASPDESTRRTRVFYCDPSMPSQKGSAERHHEQIRRIIPPGHSIEHLEQSDITLMMNHINSYVRESLGNKTPYELCRYLYGQEILDLLGAKLIPANEVIMLPSLLKK